jgi:hypothetical protein
VNASRAGLATAAVGLAFIALMTLQSSPESVERVQLTPWWCLVCGELGVVDVVLNIVLFIPFGFGLRAAGLSRRRVLLIAACISGAIELIQAFVLIGRDATLSDFLTNSAGGFAGAVLADRWRTIVLPAPKTARLLAGLGAAAWLGLQAFTAWTLAPAFPREPYWGQWAPELGQFDRFTGSVVQARLAGTPMPGTRLADSLPTRARLAAGPAQLEATAISGQPTARLAPIVSVFNGHQREVILLGQQGADLVFRLTMRASNLLLRGPAIRLEQALPESPGDTVRVRGALDHNVYKIAIERDGRTLRRALALSPSWGWSLLLPFGDYSFGGEVHLLTALWIAGLMLVVGAWAARGWAGPESALVAPSLLAVTIVGGLWLVPLVAHFRAVHWSEWAAAGMGAALGSMLGARG